MTRPSILLLALMLPYMTAFAAQPTCSNLKTLYNHNCCDNEEVSHDVCGTGTSWSGTDNKCIATNCPTKAPTKAPTKYPTKYPTKAPTSSPSPRYKYIDCVLKDNPIGYYRLDGDAMDTTGEFHGLINQKIKWSDHGACDTCGTSAEFEGGGEGGRISINTLPHMYTPFAVEYWMKPLSINDVDGAGVLALRGDNQDFNFFITSDSRLILFGGGDVADGGIVSVGEWHYVVGTISGSKMELYVNANLVDEHFLARQTQALSDGKMYIGTLGANNPQVYNGYLDEVAIYTNWPMNMVENHYNCANNARD